MERIVEQAFLYDFYGELLTKHQQQIYEDFVLNDLSLSEIAAEYGVSRQGIHDIVKRCDKALAEYEEKLHLVEKFLDTKKKVSEIYGLVKKLEYSEQLQQTEQLQQLKQIEQIAEEILNNL